MSVKVASGMSAYEFFTKNMARDQKWARKVVAGLARKLKVTSEQAAQALIDCQADNDGREFVKSFN